MSPHIQVSFPVTDRTNFRLSYAHQVQAPDWSLVLGGINTDLDKTNTNQLYGTDLDFAKTITFEFGVRHSFSDDMVLDIAAYNKDKLSDATARNFKLYDPISGLANQETRFYVNSDFGTIRGVDVRLDRRFGALFNGTLAYSFQDAKNTGTDPNFYQSIIQFIATPGWRRCLAAPGDPAVHRQPAAQLCRLGGADLPGQLACGFDRRYDSVELRCLRHLPAGQRHGVHPLPRGRQQPALQHDHPLAEHM